MFFPRKDLCTIEVNLSDDIQRIATWFEENELIINLKKGKSEVMLFGTSQKLSKLRDTLSISYRGTCINVTSHYKYLGVDIDSTLNLNSHFDRTYKKATGRLKLLGKLRSQLDEKSAKAIYTSMIVPTVTYNCILQGSLTANQKYKLSSIVNRAKSIINQRRDVSLPSLENETKKQTCFFVKKCIDGVICDEFRDYYNLMQHNYGTRNKGISIRIPKMRTEYGKKSVWFNGGKVFNELPVEIRNIENFKIFKDKVTDFYH